MISSDLEFNNEMKTFTKGGKAEQSFAAWTDLLKMLKVNKHYMDKKNQTTKTLLQKWTAIWRLKRNKNGTCLMTLGGVIGNKGIEEICN